MESDKYLHYFDCDDDFTGVYVENKFDEGGTCLDGAVEEIINVSSQE